RDEAARLLAAETAMILGSSTAGLSTQLAVSALGGRPVCLEAILRLRVLSRLTVTIDEAKDTYSLSSTSAILRSYDLVAVAPRSEKLFHTCCSSLDIDIISFNLAER